MYQKKVVMNNYVWNCNDCMYQKKVVIYNDVWKRLSLLQKKLSCTTWMKVSWLYVPEESCHVPLCIKVWRFYVVMYNTVWKCDDFIVAKEICYVQVNNNMYNYVQNKIILCTYKKVIM